MTVRDIRSAATFKKTVLIIDDQAVALNIHQAILASLNLNLNIVTKTNPAEALIWAENKHIDLIITDFSMGEIDGMQVIQAMSGANNPHLTPIIVITVLNNKQLHKALISAGASACLTKPVNRANLGKVACFLLEGNSLRYTNNQKWS